MSFSDKSCKPHLTCRLENLKDSHNISFPKRELSCRRCKMVATMKIACTLCPQRKLVGCCPCSRGADAYGAERGQAHTAAAAALGAKPAAENKGTTRDIVDRQSSVSASKCDPQINPRGAPGVPEVASHNLSNAITCHNPCATKCQGLSYPTCLQAASRPFHTCMWTSSLLFMHTCHQVGHHVGPTPPLLSAHECQTPPLAFSAHGRRRPSHPVKDAFHHMQAGIASLAQPNEPPDIYQV